MKCGSVSAVCMCIDEGVDAAAEEDHDDEEKKRVAEPMG